MDKGEFAYFLPFVAAVFVFIFSVPIVDLPLNDDVVYFDSVQNFVQNGGLINNQPYASSLVLQTLYGSLFAYIFGLSHSTLMLSMMVMGGLAVVATYFLLRTRLDPKYSVLGSMLLLTNPIFFNLTHTFMTDVMGLFFVVASAIFLMKFSQNKKYGFLVLGLVLAIAGFWVRQFSILVVGGLFLYLLLKDRKTLLRPGVISLIVLLPLASVAVWGYWFYALHDQSYVCQVVFALGPNVAKNLVQMFIYSGYFVFPLGLAFLLNYKKVSGWLRGLGRTRMAIPIFILLLMVAFIFVREYVGLSPNPFATSLAWPGGLGAYTMSGEKSPLFPDVLWAPITALSLVSAFSVLTLYLGRLRENLFLVLTMAAMAVLPLVNTAFFDRYYLYIIPLSLPAILVAMRDFKYAKHVVVFSIIAMGAWSWYGTYEYLAWNTARWEGINHLLASGIDQTRIDGGLEYDARFFDKCSDRSAAVNWHGWGYSLSDEYVVSFSELDGYSTVEKTDYLGPFGERMGSVFVEKKSGQAGI